jgi:hypothetical protein
VLSFHGRFVTDISYFPLMEWLAENLGLGEGMIFRPQGCPGVLTPTLIPYSDKHRQLEHRW